MRRSSVTSAAALSSHELSRPRITLISCPALCLTALRCTRGEPMQGLRLGTRGSPLALAQARKVAAAIETSQRWPDGWVHIVEIKTTGDKVQDRPLAEIGGKALWAKDLDRAVIGMECRTNDTRTQSVLSTVSNGITYNCVMAERTFTRALGGSCQSPVAAFCAFEDGDLRLRAQLFSEDGSEMVEERVVFDCG